MIPTAATSSGSNQSASSATIGIASLILEGRPLSDDDFVITNNTKKHVLYMPPGFVTRSPINITTNPSAEVTSALLYKSNVNSNDLPTVTATTTLAATSSAAASVSDATLQHFERLRQKLTQLRQSSPSTSREPYPSGEHKIVVGASTGLSSSTGGTATGNDNVDDDDLLASTNQTNEENQNDILLKRYLSRRSSYCGFVMNGSNSGSGGGGSTSTLTANQMNQQQTSDNNLLYTLQSLASTCLWTRNRDFMIEQQQQQYGTATTSTNGPVPTRYYFKYHPTSDYFGNAASSSSGSNSCNNNNNNNHKNSNRSYQKLLSNCDNNGICNDYKNKNNHHQVPPKQGPHCDQFLKKLGMMGKCSNISNNSSNNTTTTTTTGSSKLLDFEEHICDMANLNEICYHWQLHCRQIEVMLSRSDPICIEVYLGPENHEILLEQWIIEETDTPTTPTMTLQSLCNAIRSQLYFSQITAWTDLIKKYQPYDKEIEDNGRIKSMNNTKNLFNKKPRLDIYYRIRPYDSTASFMNKPNVHNFPNVVISDNCALTVCLKSLPRLQNGIPIIDETTVTQTVINNLTTSSSMVVAGTIAGSTAVTASATTTTTTILQQPPTLASSASSTITGINLRNNNKQQQQPQQLQQNHLLSGQIIDSTSNNDINAQDFQDDQDESMLLDDVLLDESSQDTQRHKCAHFDIDYYDDEDEDEVDEGGISSDNFHDFNNSCDNMRNNDILNSKNGSFIGSGSSNSCSSTSSGSNISHREKQLMKYRKRIIKRDKKKKSEIELQRISKIDQNVSGGGGGGGGTSSSSNNGIANMKVNRIIDEPMKIDINNFVAPTVANSNVSGGGGVNENLNHLHLHQQQQQHQEYASINSMRPPLYQTAAHAISESIQTQSIEMISIGTQTTTTTTQTKINNNCDQCNNEMSYVCLNCYDIKSKSHHHHHHHHHHGHHHGHHHSHHHNCHNKLYNNNNTNNNTSDMSMMMLMQQDDDYPPKAAQAQPAAAAASAVVVGKGDLLLQAIQRTAKNKSSHRKNYNNNNNNNSLNYRNAENHNGGNGGGTFNTNNGINNLPNDCQLCKRQKTQHNYKMKNDENFSNNNNNYNSNNGNSNNNNKNNNNNNNCCNFKENCNNKKCKCLSATASTTTTTTLTVNMDDDDEYYGKNNITAMQNTTTSSSASTTTSQQQKSNIEQFYINHNSNETADTITPNKNHNYDLIQSTNSDSSNIDISAQFKTPKFGYLTPKNINYNKSQQQQQNNAENSIVKKKSFHCNSITSSNSSINSENCISSMKKALPKINLSNVFCNNSNNYINSATSTNNSQSSTIPVLPIGIDDNKMFSTTLSLPVTTTITTTTNSIPPNPLPSIVTATATTIIIPPDIPVQKSNSAPALPNSPSLSPRFIKQAAIYKRRSRHLSDRSDRSSFGSDEQLSDEDLDSSAGFSPAGSPIKNKFFTRVSNVFGRRPLLGNLEETILQKRLVPKTQVAGFKVLLGASGGFCPTQLTIPASAYFYELDGQALSTPYLCEIRLSRKGYTIPRFGTVQATLLNPIGTVVRMFVIPYDLRDMPPMNQTFIRQRILAVDSEPTIDSDNGCSNNNNNNSNSNNKYDNNNDSNNLNGSNIQPCSKEQMRSLRYSIHVRFQTSRSGRLTLHTDIRFLISRRTDSDTAAAHAKGALESPNELKIVTQQPDNPKYSARQDNTNQNKI